MNSAAKNASPSFLEIKKIDIFWDPWKNENQKSGLVMSSALIKSLYMTEKNSEMNSAAKNASPSFVEI